MLGQVNTCAWCCILSKQRLFFLRHACLSGVHRAEAALFEFRSQADGALAGLRSRSQPRREGSIRARALVSYTCMGHWHCLAGTNTHTHTHTHRGWLPCWHYICLCDTMADFWSQVLSCLMGWVKEDMQKGGVCVCVCVWEHVSLVLWGPIAESDIVRTKCQRLLCKSLHFGGDK